MMITVENKTKRQKNGNVHHYVYYRCTKKHKTTSCKEQSLRSHVLDRQLSSLIKTVTLPTDWSDELNRMAKDEHKETNQSVAQHVKEKEDEIQNIIIKLDRLLTGYLEEVVDELEYRKEKAKLLLQKKTLESEISSLSHTANDWLAPLQDWLKDATSLGEIASDDDLFAKKVAAKEIFGSHLRLGGRQLTLAAGEVKENGSSSVPTQWAALRAAHCAVGQRPLRSILVCLLYQARTYFQSKH